MGEETAAGAVLRHLHELKTALGGDASLDTRIVQASRHVPPRLLVSNRATPSLADMIGCEPNVMDGLRMWFVFSWGAAIAPAADLERAAKDIGRVLS